MSNRIKFRFRTPVRVPETSFTAKRVIVSVIKTEERWNTWKVSTSALAEVGSKELPFPDPPLQGTLTEVGPRRWQWDHPQLGVSEVNGESHRTIEFFFGGCPVGIRLFHETEAGQRAEALRRGHQAQEALRRQEEEAARDAAARTRAQARARILGLCPWVEPLFDGGMPTDVLRAVRRLGGVGPPWHSRMVEAGAEAWMDTAKRQLENFVAGGRMHQFLGFRDFRPRTPRHWAARTAAAVIREVGSPPEASGLFPGVWMGPEGLCGPWAVLRDAQRERGQPLFPLDEGTARRLTRHLVSERDILSDLAREAMRSPFWRSR